MIIFTFTLVTQEFIYALTFITAATFLVRGDVYFWGVPIAFLYNFFLDRFIAGFTVGAIK